MNDIWWLWILGILLCGIIEVTSVNFVFLMSTIGALTAGIADAFGANLTIQVIVFIVVSIALLVILHPFLRGRIDRSSGYIPSNTDGLIGKTGYVTKAVGKHHGRIQFSGRKWSARIGGPTPPVGTEVRVDRIDGATAVVSALDPASVAPTHPCEDSTS